MTFDELMDVSSSQDFLLKEGSVGSNEYVFENSAGNKLHFKRLDAGVVGISIPAWAVDLDGNRVEFSHPAQLLTVNTIITGLVTRSIRVVQERASTENTEE